MANEPLKELYKTIRTDEREMAVYRAGLGRELSKSRQQSLWRGWLVAVPVALVLLLVFVPRQQALPEGTPEQLKDWVMTQTSPDTVRERAIKAFAGSDPLKRSNAALILCLLGPESQGIAIASELLPNEPRPDFRSFYLEYLLDHADEYRFNMARIENLMDDEADPLCLSLYRKLLHFPQTG